ncbi:ABC transporter ATP-binding protein [Rubrivivax gelatinosus]|uniref:ABC transporter ATP-binding protein n=1 Tax=Rubrivivax gelatinosus TaxID=28068 RepID=A0ABS1DYI4_RUBGE|nr:putative 2-aminoethylphosphonate ABC transporter ATP-binding protein [Rubrivivax gelatinosus]MBK1613255.1 ABC transporter ATP-binding protein [Rubrivivax gelatinosus]MBK1714573.1 ABC transporter ATP-binding protein [Rubrivivax gelatinosus]
MAHLEVHALGKRFGRFVALEGVDLAVERGEFVVLLGPSGCGKTTLLRLIAGLERQDQGRIVHAGRDVSALPPAARDYGIVFQSYALFPNLDVAANVGYGLGTGRAARAAVQARVAEMLQLVGLPGIEHKYPAQLSGGQQQRVALARALATRPDLLLLDEPLSALDAIERVRLRGEIRALQQRLGVTTLMVTHDQEEALAMADRVVVMRAGRLQQIGTPEQIYRQPHNAFVADFIGRSNLVEATADDDGRLLFAGSTLRSDALLQPGQRYRFSVRPEDIRLLDTLDTAENSFWSRVQHCEFLGPVSLVTLEPEGAPPLVAQFSANYLGARTLAPGATLRIAIPAERLLPMPEAA